MYEILNDRNTESSTTPDTKNNLLTEKDDKDLYPNKLNIIIFTNISDESIDYNPKMSYPSTSSSSVYFSPFVKLSETDLVPDISLLSGSKELPKKTFDIFFNEKNFNELLQKKVDQNSDNFLKIEQSCKDKVIDNNIKNILNILFKSGNLFYIKDKPYTINNYEWTTGDWFIYSSELDKNTKINEDPLKREKETNPEIQTKKAYEIISKKTPNCLKGDASISLIHSENQKKQYQQKMSMFTNNNFFNKENIDQIFKTYKEMSSNMFNNYLCFNLNDQIPSFDKDPLTISLLYIGNNFIKDIEAYPILLKYYNAVTTNASELNEIITELNNIVTKNNLLITNNNDDNNSTIKSIITYNTELTNVLKSLKKKFENHIQNNQFRRQWFNIQLGEIETIIRNYKDLSSIFKKYINDKDKDKTKTIKTFLTPQKQKEIIDKLKNIRKQISKINDNINTMDINVRNSMFSNNNITSYSSIETEYKKKIEELNNSVSAFTTDLSKIKEISNQFYDKFKLNKDKKTLPAEFIKNKIEFFKTCKKVYSLIKQKLISQNNYLNKLFVFYKILYTLKKKEYEQITNSSRTFKNADNIRLQLSIRIILFDVIIYNTLIYDKCYRNVYELYIKNIDISIKKLEEFEMKKFNIKDETKNSLEDDNTELTDLFKDYYYYIFFINFNLDKIMWDVISKKTLDIKNKFKCFISKSINEYAKNINLYEDTNETLISRVKTQMDNLYNLDFSNFSEQEAMKIICYELINLFSKLNIITLYRYYKTNKVNYFVCNVLSKKIKYYDKKEIKYSFNEIYFIYDFNNLKLNINNCISFPNKNCYILDNLCFEDYKSSIELITPSITNEQLERVCENISKTTEFDEFNNELIKVDFKQMNNNFSFPLYLLFRDLFIDVRQQIGQINNLIGGPPNPYEIIYGIYNGNQLLKTILDSIKWHLAFSNYKFIYNEECNNLNSIDKNNNNYEYKLKVISFFYENYKLNIIIIRKTKEGFNIIKNQNEIINDYPYIYVLNESIKEEIIVNLENKTSKFIETYYNIYLCSDTPKPTFIFNSALVANAPTPPPAAQLCENNVINNLIIKPIFVKEKLLQLLLKIFEIFLKIFEKIQNNISENTNVILYQEFQDYIQQVVRENNVELQKLIYQFFYVKVTSNYNNIPSKNPTAQNQGIRDIDNSNKLIFWIFYFLNIRPYLNRQNRNDNIYDINNLYSSPDLTIQNDINPYKNSQDIIPYDFQIPNPPNGMIDVRNQSYSLDNLIVIKDDDKVNLGKHIIKIYNKLIEKLIEINRLEQDAQNNQAIYAAAAVGSANYYQLQQIAQQSRRDADKAKEISTKTKELLKIELSKSINLFNRFIKNISELLDLTKDSEEDGHVSIKEFSTNELKELKNKIDSETQKGGDDQKQEVENIMKQFVKNKKIKVQIENKINDKKYNNLYYYVPIKLILNEGTEEIGLNKKLEFSCNNNYEQLRKAWALLFGIEYIPSIPKQKEEPKKEEPKKEEPKKEEPKVEEPKVEEAKVEEAKKEEAKVEEAKVEEPKKKL